MPMDYPENIRRDSDHRVQVRTKLCFCEICARDHGEEVQAIALAPQSGDGEFYRWIPVCECHLADWFLGCEGDDFPEAIKLEEEAPRIWIKPREEKMNIYRVKLRRTVVEETEVYVEAKCRAHIDSIIAVGGAETAIEQHADNTSTWEGDAEEIKIVSAQRVEKSPGPPVCKLSYGEE